MEQDYIQNIDQIRHLEYPLLEKTTYLDHAGATLYSRSLIEQFSKDMCSNLFGNPHSASPSSALSTERTERVRSRVLDFFKADPEHFDCVFVANATAAIKTVLQAFQDCGSTAATEEQPGFWYGYHVDAHTSLVGGRQLAQGGARCFRSDEEVEGWLQGNDDPMGARYSRVADSQLGLFAYPAQSNMNGHRPPLSWAGRIRSSQHTIHQNVYTMLDAAAYVSTAQLDLSDSDTAPDFTALSFYKIFGFPDLGALIVRKAAGHILRQRRYFGGGTVEMVISVDNAWHAKKAQELHDGLEDGTLPFHNIIALDSAMDSHKRLFGSMSRVSAHATFLAKRIHHGLKSMKHANGAPLCEIYKHPDSTYGDSKTQGATVAFNVRNSLGGYVGKSDVEQLAILRGIQLRTGGVCNPGGIATSLSLKSWELRKNYAEGVRCGNDFDVIAGKPTGIVRVSLGAMSSKNDVDHFLRFIREVFVEGSTTPATLVSQPDLSTAHLNTVESITVYPVRGGKGWQVPRQTPWEIKEAGLLWDREWCLVDLETGETLSVEEHPLIRSLTPSLQMEEGFLKISLPSRDSSGQTQELSVSLWESPPAAPNQSNLKPILDRADAYTSAPLAKALTLFIGVPCTLGRYPDHRLVLSRQMNQDSDEQPLLPPSAQPRRASSLTADLPFEKSFTICTSASGADDAANILTTPPLSSAWQYIRIGSHYFRSLGGPVGGPTRRLRHLPNVFDLSPTAQNPTITVGDAICTFSADDVADDEGLRACINAATAANFICPVPSCRRECVTKEQRTRHLRVHGSTVKEQSDRQASVEPSGQIKDAAPRGGLLSTMRRWSTASVGKGKHFVVATVHETVVRNGSASNSSISEEDKVGRKQVKGRKVGRRQKVNWRVGSMFR